MGTLTLYFDGYNAAEVFSTSPANGVDGSTATFAASATIGQVQNLNSLSDCDAIFGSITKVELRGHGYKSGGVQASYLYFRPVFAAGDGPNQSYTLNTTAGWSAWFDITAVSNAPEAWTWAAILALGCDVQAQPSTGRTVYFSRVEIQVTYNELPGASGGLCAGGSPATVTTTSNGGAAATVTSGAGGLLLGGSDAGVQAVQAVNVGAAGAGLLPGSTACTVQGIQSPSVASLGGGVLFGGTPEGVLGERTTAVVSPSGGFLAGGTPAAYTTAGVAADLLSAGGGLLLGGSSTGVVAERSPLIGGAGGGLLFGGTSSTVRARTVPYGYAGAPGLGRLGGRHAPAAPGMGHAVRGAAPHGPGVGWSGRVEAQAPGSGWAGARRPGCTQMGHW